MSKAPKDVEAGLSAHLSKRFREEGIQVPDTFPNEIVAILQTLTGEEIERALLTHYTAAFKPPR